MASDCYTAKFFAELQDGSARSARIVVPLVLELIPARSVIDVGCGQGAWLAEFRRVGVEDILGIDGDYVDRRALQIAKERFQVEDLSTPLRLKRTFDLALSLEVAEHLPPACAAIFVESLTRLAPVILFSAAIPFQGGTRHVNEQWPDYWAALFRERNYVLVDCLRSRVWEDEDVDWWYAQNIMFFIRSDFLASNSALGALAKQTHVGQVRLVHPRNYIIALQPIEFVPWNAKVAGQLFATCALNAIRRRVAKIIGRKGLPTEFENPMNFNPDLEDERLYGIVKRPSRG